MSRLGRPALDDVQSQLRTDRNNATPYSQEKACSLQLRKWLHVEESALAQKARIQWLKLGDSNNQFFFRAIKERLADNHITVLYNARGDKLITKRDSCLLY